MKNEKYNSLEIIYNLLRNKEVRTEIFQIEI